MNNTNIAKSSSLPKIIPKLKIHFAKLDNSPKFPLGPIILPSPGPTFEIAVAAPEKEVIKSNPVKDNNIATKKKIKKYKYMKVITEDINDGLILFLLYLIGNIPLGYKIFLIWVLKRRSETKYLPNRTHSLEKSYNLK